MLANDLVLVADREKDTKVSIEVLNEVMTKWMMKINLLEEDQGDGSAEIGRHMSHTCGWSIYRG